MHNIARRTPGRGVTRCRQACWRCRGRRKSQQDSQSPKRVNFAVIREEEEEEEDREEKEEEKKKTMGKLPVQPKTVTETAGRVTVAMRKLQTIGQQETLRGEEVKWEAEGVKWEAGVTPTEYHQ
eukprot:GGOE01030695.1.p1 GENE.GGOE01030695.1~~GGOE01030695.1.p1  ORF type:complete len:124 (+),score=12.61 GGOE01030695.1:434-805(+)